MRTATKLAIAKLAYRLTHVGRRLSGRGDRCVVERHGLKFELDLSQGIDLAIYLQGHFGPSTARALARYVVPSHTVIDIGANIGAYTLHMAKLVGTSGRVFAFEPTDFAYRKLQRNLDLNSSLRTRVATYCCFLGPHDDGNVPPAIYASWPLAGGDDLHARHFGEPKSTAAAVFRSLDSVLAEHGNPAVNLVKLDVDGFECDVLSGATETMRRHRPVFVMEVAPYVLEERGASLEKLLSFFSPLGYRLYDERTDRELPNDASLLGRLIEPGESKNVVAHAR
jgi:FkbM family methyltransferase